MATSLASTMTDAQFERLSTIIYDKSGIHFPAEKKFVLESRLGARLAELEIADYDHYLSLLSMGPFQGDEFQEMFDRITVNETSFFRNEMQLKVFECQVLAKLLEQRRESKRLRIWSAACSTGDEPYTLAILVHRTLGIRLQDWHIEILGTDISEAALETASRARYGDYALRNTPSLVRERYFREECGQWALDETIRSMVSFETHNLKDRLAARRHGTWDVIFCRNVMIYFDDAMKARALGMFADQLADDGHLFIGHSESIRGDGLFEPLGDPQAFCYRRSRR